VSVERTANFNQSVSRIESFSPDVSACICLLASAGVTYNTESEGKLPITQKYVQRGKKKKFDDDK